MLTLQIQIDESTMADVENSLDVLSLDRDEFFKDAIKLSAARLKREAEVSILYRKAYQANPIGHDEFLIDEEQVIESWKDLPWEPKQ